MLIRKPSDIPSSEITSEEIYRQRRRFLGQSSALIAGVGLGLPAPVSQAGLQQDDDITPEEIVTQYNNFYEFGTDKSDPYANASALTTDPWTVSVSGEAKKTGDFAFEDVIKGLTPEERIYRFRCVEAWSMVVFSSNSSPRVMPSMWCSRRCIGLKKWSGSGLSFLALTGPMSRGCAWMRPITH